MLNNVIFRSAAGAIALLLAGCAALSQMGQPSPGERARETEQMLSAAGFRMIAADSEQKLGQLKNLPQLSVKYYPDKEGSPHYWMADANFCHCLYVGDAKAYQQYQNLRLQRRTAEEQQAAAEMQMEAAQQQQMMMSPFGMMGGRSVVSAMAGRASVSAGRVSASSRKRHATLCGRNNRRRTKRVKCAAERWSHAREARMGRGSRRSIGIVRLGLVRVKFV